MEISEEDIQKQYEEKVGTTEQVREERLAEVRSELVNVLGQNRCRIAESPEDIAEQSVFLEGRVKTLDSVVGKINRTDERFEDLKDIWGLRIVAENDEVVSKIASILTANFLNFHESLAFKTVNDLRSEFGVRPEESVKEFNPVIIRKVGPYGLVSVQVITKEIWERMQDPNDPISTQGYQERKAKS